MNKIEVVLQKREESGILRRLVPASLRKNGKIYFGDKEFEDFSSNDYLGLADHPKLKEAAKKAIEEFGVSASGSRLLSGDLEIHHELEERVSNFVGKESALLFGSGYQANVGIISALCDRGDVIFSDRLNHASIIDGILLSRAKFFRFHHNDLEELESLLKRERQRYQDALIITETIFSMDGDRALLKELVELKEKYDCKIMVDEAHATGIFGEKGAGVVEEEGLTERVDLIMGTFSKGLGSFGAYVVSSRMLINYLINKCRTFIYSTAPPPSVVEANIAALVVIKEEPYRRRVLLENADYFRQALTKKGFRTKGSSQIVPLITGNNERTIFLSNQLKEKGIWVKPILPPTVPHGEARLRFSLGYPHSKEILMKVVDNL